jgi:hypothetical protein
MRFMLKISIPTEIGNQRVLDGSLGTTIESILRDLKPEAAYFSEDRGVRTGFIFCNIQDESEIPGIAEPWFLAFGAHVELHAAMTLSDLKKAASGFEKAIKTYGQMPKAS